MDRKNLEKNIKKVKSYANIAIIKSFARGRSMARL